MLTHMFLSNSMNVLNIDTPVGKPKTQVNKPRSLLQTQIVWSRLTRCNVG